MYLRIVTSSTFLDLRKRSKKFCTVQKANFWTIFYLYFYKMVPTTKILDLKKLKRDHILRESYKRADFYSCVSFFRCLWLWQTDQITEKEFKLGISKQKLQLEIKDSNQLLVNGRFSPDTGFTTIAVSRRVLDIIKCIESKYDAFEYSQLKKLAEFFWSCFVHEDTHKQQIEATPFKFFDNYVHYDFNSDPFDLSILQNIKYFNQSIEADAFGREVGEALRLEYQERDDKNANLTPIENIFEWVNARDIEDEHALTLIKTYKDPRISEKAQKSFFRALYDYLVDILGEESIF